MLDELALLLRIADAYWSRNDDGTYAWKAFFCPTPKGTPGQCKPNFLPKS